MGQSPKHAGGVIVKQQLSEYTWSTCFDHWFIRELTFEGFLCIACELTGTPRCPLFILIPKARPGCFLSQKSSFLVV